MKKLITLSLIAMMASTVVAFHNEGSDCARCHLVHMATDNAGVPLWNGAQSITYKSFTDYYTGFDMDATVGTSPEGSTLLCLSCHDAGAHHQMTTVQGSMRGTHPIEFVYDAALAVEDGELNNPETTDSGVYQSNGKIADDMLIPETGVMNCVSCHDIHIQGLDQQAAITVDDGAGGTVSVDVSDMSIPHLKRIEGIKYEVRYGGDKTNAADYALNYSALCTTCHVK